MHMQIHVARFRALFFLLIHRYERLILSKFNYDIFQTYEMSDINYRQLFQHFRAYNSEDPFRSLDNIRISIFQRTIESINCCEYLSCDKLRCCLCEHRHFDWLFLLSCCECCWFDMARKWARARAVEAAKLNTHTHTYTHTYCENAY